MKWNIRPRVIAGFISMSVLFILFGAMAILYTDRMLGKTRDMLKENVSSLKAAEELEIALLDMKGIAANYLLDGQTQWLNIFREKDRVFRRWFGVAWAQARTEEERQLLSETEALFGRYQGHYRTMRRLHQEGDADAARLILNGSMRDTFSAIYEKCENYLFINEKIMHRTSEQLVRENRFVRAVMVVFAAGSVLLGVVFGVLIARSITQPLYRLIVNVKGAAGEDVLEEMDIPDESEFDKLDKHIRVLIDRIHRTNRDLSHSRRLLMQSEKLAMLGSVAAGLAHEIRNPLTSIKMLIYSLRDKAGGHSQTLRDYDVMLQQITRMESFLQAFLDFARPPEPEFKKVRLGETLDQALRLLRPQIEAARVRLKTAWVAPDPVVRADPGQLKQVVVNLILNAVQAMSGGGRLSIETAVTAGPDGQAEIRVSDNGPGIPEELLPSLFEPFTTTKKSGTGLGLAISQQIVKNHGGIVQVENIRPHGARFVVQLPYTGGASE